MEVFMRGIAGFTSLRGQARGAREIVLSNMVQAVEHRGVGGEHYFDEAVALGNAVRKGHYAISFDGDLYNADELRRDLRRLGHRFESATDSEVAMCGYMEWNEACISRFNGVFAFAIWDAQSKKLFTARDRLAVKPLFFTALNDDIYFCSEIKGLLSLPDSKAEIDKQGLAEILALLPSRSPGFGIFKGIQELKSGYYLTWQNGVVNTHKYWGFESKPHDDNVEQTAEEVRHLFEKAVKMQLKSEAPFACLLSGGLDSSAITAIAAREFDKVDTYSFSYIDNDKNFVANNFQPNSDDEWAIKVAGELGTNHRILTADTADLIDNLYAAVRARDLPAMADIDSSLLYYCGKIQPNHSVILSGEGADEIFGGYPWFHNSADAQGFPWIRGLDDRLSFFKKELVQYSDCVNYQQQRYFEEIAKTPKLAGESAADAKIRELFYVNLHWFGANLIERTDRMSAAAGIDARMPFLDYELAEYVWNIPWNMKALDGREKGILRLALRGLLPDSVLERKKSPYPKTHNPIYFEAVKRELRKILDDSQSKIHLLIDKNAAYNLINGKCNMNIPFYGQLMNCPQICAWLLQLNFWLEDYKVEIV